MDLLPRTPRGRHRAASARDQITRLRAEVQRLRRALEREQHAARHDALTGLLNRYGVDHRAGAMLTDGSPPTVAMLLDLDGFKAVNDSLGHAAGDEVLVTVARRLASHAPPEWLLGRLGGDEFVGVSNRPADEQRLLTWAGSLSSALSLPIRVAGRLVTVTAAIGLATGDGRIPLRELLRRADVALYRSKDAGRPVMWDRRLDHAHVAVEHAPLQAVAGRIRMVA